MVISHNPGLDGDWSTQRIMKCILTDQQPIVEAVAEELGSTPKKGDRELGVSVLRAGRDRPNLRAWF